MMSVRNLACVSRIAVAVIRLDLRFERVPHAIRHSVSREQEVPAAILKPSAT